VFRHTCNNVRRTGPVLSFTAGPEGLCVRARSADAVVAYRGPGDRHFSGRGFDPSGVLAALIVSALGGAMLAIPLFGYGPVVAVMLGLVLGTALMEQLRESVG
jgi:hypothetical protein